MSAGNVLPVSLPVRLGLPNGHQPSMIYGADGLSVVMCYSVNQNGTLEQARNDPHCVKGLARADYMVLAMNAYPVLLQALMAASAALEHSAPDMAHYPEPVQRHDHAKKSVAAALAAVGLGEKGEPRWGWSADEQGIIYTPEGAYELVQQGLPITGDKAKVARYIADAVNVLHTLGGRGV